MADTTIVAGLKEAGVPDPDAVMDTFLTACEVEIKKAFDCTSVERTTHVSGGITTLFLTEKSRAFLTLIRSEDKCIIQINKGEGYKGHADDVLATVPFAEFSAQTAAQKGKTIAQAYIANAKANLE